MYIDFEKGDTQLVLWVLEGSLLAISPGLRLDRTDMLDLWENLPLDNVEDILMMVPDSSKFRFRSVCKLWKKDLSSSYLWQLHSAPNVSDRLIPFQCRAICAFQFNSNLAMCKLQVGSLARRESHVQTIDLSFLPSEILQSHRDISVQDGLMMMKDSWTGKMNQEIDVVVVNPFTRTWMKLPRYELPSELGNCKKYSLKVEVDSTSNSNFTVYFLMRLRPLQSLRADGHPVLLERCGLLTYFSKANSWKLDVWPGSTRTRCDIASTTWWTRMCMVSDDGSIIRGNMPTVLATVGNANCRVMCIQDDTYLMWNHLNTTMKNRRGFVTYGSIFFFVRQENSVNSQYKVEISIYKINQQGEWELFSVMPAEYCEIMLSKCEVIRGKKLLELQRVAVVGNLLCLTMATKIKMNMYVLHVAAFHVDERKWRMVSKIPYKVDKTQEESGKLELLLLQPRLDFFVQPLL